MALAVLLALALAACGGGSTSGTASTTQPAQKQSPQLAAEVAKNRELGQTALLRLKDFPAGWTAGPREKESKSRALDQEVAKCLGVSPSLFETANPAKVESPKFKEGESDAIQHAVTVTLKEEIAKEYFSVYSNPKIPPCLTSALQKRVAAEIAKESPEVTIGKTSVEQMSFPQSGTESVAYRVTVPIKAKGVEVSVYLDLVAMRVGRGGSTLSFQGIPSPVSSELEQKYARLTAQRLESALAGAASAEA